MTSRLLHLRPRADYVLVRRDPAPERDGLITLPEDARPRARFGTVLAVGPGRFGRKRKGVYWFETGQRLPMTLEPGDRVVLELAYKHEVYDSDTREVFVLARESALLAKLEP